MYDLISHIKKFVFMKAFKFFLVAALAVFLVSCKGSMTPISKKIQGPLGDYFEVVSKDYKAVDGKVSIEIKRVKDGFPDPWIEGMEVGYLGGQFTPTFSVEFQDASGNVVSKDATDIVFDEKELEAVAALAVGETATITFDCDKDADKFKISSDFEVHQEIDSSSSYSSSGENNDDTSFSADESTGSDSESMSSSSSSSSEDWDAVLDSYSSYVDQYVALVKKAAKGDLTAMGEYASFLEKSEELSDKLERAKSDMSSSQVARYMKISAKMLKAASEMN